MNGRTILTLSVFIVAGVALSLLGVNGAWLGAALLAFVCLGREGDTREQAKREEYLRAQADKAQRELREARDKHRDCRDELQAAQRIIQEQTAKIREREHVIAELENQRTEAVMRAGAA